MPETHNNRPGKVRITPGYTCGGTDYRYKCWDNLDNLKTSNGIAYCRHPNYTYPTVAGKNGTYKQPAPLDLTEFGYNFTSDETIDSITVTYATQTFINEGYYPDFAQPVVSLLNTNLPSKQIATEKITGTKKTYTHTWKNVPVSMVNSSAFGVRFAFDQNRNTTPGRIELSDFKLEIVTTDYSDKIDLNVDAPSKLTMGVTTEITAKITKSSQGAYSTDLLLELPFGVEIVGDPTRVDGNIAWQSMKSTEGNVYHYYLWHVDLPAGSSNALLKFNIKAVRPSNTFTHSNKKRITQLRLYDENTDLEYNTLINVTQIEAVVQSDFFKEINSIRSGKAYDYTVKCYSHDPMRYDKILHMKFRDGIDIIINTDEILEAFTEITSITFNSSTGEYLFALKKQNIINIDIPVSVIFELAGEYDFKAWVTIAATGEVVSPIFEESCVVLSTDYQKLGFTRILLDKYTDIMAEGIEYTLGSMMKVTQHEQNYELIDLGNNYRIGVYNGGATDIDDDVDFIDNVIWSEDLTEFKQIEQKVNFVYHEDQPLYLVYTHTYTADATGPYMTVNFSEPILAEKGIYEQVRDNTKISLRPTVNLLLNDEYATAEMQETTPEINRVAIDQWNDGGLFDKDISILGMSLTFDYDFEENATVEAELFVNNTISGTRDLLLNKGKGTATLGTVYDLFGLSPSDLIDRDKLCIRPFEVRFFVTNPYMVKNKVQIKNCVITIEYIQRSNCQYGFTLDGEYSKDYGIVLSEVSHPRGTKNEKSLYHVSGTDETIVNRVNVDSKEIEVSIVLGNSCEIEDQRYIIDRIVELFTNDRYLDSNKPIPKKLVFDHLPDRYYEVVRVDEFDDEFQIGKYNATISLLVPNGSTYDLEETVTGRHGYSPSSIAVRPTVEVIATTAGQAIIYEEITQQEMRIKDNRIVQGSTILIDSQNREAYVDNVLITEKVDYNSTWFKLRGEYNFTSETGTVVKVSYRIRRG